MAIFRSSLLLAFSAAALLAQPANRYPVDWAKLTPEILERFIGLLRIDTSNPPGNETAAATHLRQILENEWIACRMFALEPTRANLVARIKGSAYQNSQPSCTLRHRFSGPRPQGRNNRHTGLREEEPAALRSQFVILDKRWRLKEEVATCALVWPSAVNSNR